MTSFGNRRELPDGPAHQGSSTRPEMILPAVMAIALGLGWSARERAFAQEKRTHSSARGP